MVHLRDTLLQSSSERATIWPLVEDVVRQNTCVSEKGVYYDGAQHDVWVWRAPLAQNHAHEAFRSPVK